MLKAEDFRCPSTKPTKYGRCLKCNYASCQCYRIWRVTHCGCGAEKTDDYACAECGKDEDECFCDAPF